MQADPTTPPGLVREQLPLKVGDAIQADRIQGAEANVSLVLPQRGYPFVKVGDRDILLDDQSAKATGAYTPAGRYRPALVVRGADHHRRSGVRSSTTSTSFRASSRASCTTARLTDDLRDALVATGIFSTDRGRAGADRHHQPDGTEQVDLLVRQAKGPPRTLARGGGLFDRPGRQAAGVVDPPQPVPARRAR